MPSSVKGAAKDALENLIEQFSDIYCFYRELVQNSLDAGSSRVDISLEYKHAEKGKKKGVMIIHVDDYGEGMNRDIIDNQLTRLFSSSKEDDFSKIGKFGIGFVSVFAMKPDAVVIDTSRDGENWRIIFNKSKEFERLVRDYPVDGTKIQIIKSCTKKYYGNFYKKSMEAVYKWCRHSDSEIYFGEERVNQPFDVESDLKVHIKENAGELVAGFSSEKKPFFGFYNKGLTLVEGNKEYFPNVTFKVKSKYLEHTLTRDNIREEENYHKVMEMLKYAAEVKLPEILFRTLKEELENNQSYTERYKNLFKFVWPYVAQRGSLPDYILESFLFLDVYNKPLSIKDILKMKSQEAVFVDERQNPVTDALRQKNVRVIKASVTADIFDLLKKITYEFFNHKKVYRASAYYFVTNIIGEHDLSVAEKKLVKKVNYVIRKVTAGTPGIVFADFNYDDSSVADKIYLLLKEPSAALQLVDQSLENNGFKGLFSSFFKMHTLVVNKSHPYVKKLIRLSESDVGIAAYFLARLIHLKDGVLTATDADLAAAALERSVPDCQG